MEMSRERREAIEATRWEFAKIRLQIAGQVLAGLWSASTVPMMVEKNHQAALPALAFLQADQLMEVAGFSVNLLDRQLGRTIDD